MYRAPVIDQRSALSRPTVLRGVALGALLALAGTLLAPAGVEAASDRLPDLRSARIGDLRIVRSDGRTYLRFTSEFRNYGAGPFEIRGSRPSRTAAFDIDQVIYRSDGHTRRVDSPATVAYAGDGHDHYHVRRMMSYHLWSTSGTLRDRKIGFCFFDTNPRYLSLPRAPSRRHYVQSTCGTRTSLSIRSGLSVGWGDRYPWNFAYQWIDITGLPAGTYTLRSAVDLFGQFVESSDANNCAYARISIRGTTVRVLGSGDRCLNDYAETPYAADVTWALDQRLQAGCDPLLFCTYNPMLRDEMAVFLTRLLALPATSVDAYDDDDGARYEASINRVAAAGLIDRCGVRRFCPARTLTRAELAVALARALDLPPSETDHFTDDDGTSAEAAIDSVADAGLMSGCAAERFCPTVTLRRGATVRILRRAFEAPG